MSTIKLESREISTECTCEWEDCYGCFDVDKNEMLNFIKEWECSYAPESWEGNVRIEGSGMGLRAVTGVAIVDITDILPALSLNGDYRLVVTTMESLLSAVRYSHDEPCGASFRITFTNEESNQ